MQRRLSVKEIMSRKPVVVEYKSTVSEAARLMMENDVGSLIVVKRKKPVGIVTERDILIKVIAQEIDPSNVRVKEVMSSPVIATEQGTDFNEAAEKMARLKIRRLPVVENGKLVGMLTESDILKVAPDLIEITREFSKINSGNEGIGDAPGLCEVCMSYSDELVQDQEGRLVCTWCNEKH